jgi:hypothetical protein
MLYYRASAVAKTGEHALQEPRARVANDYCRLSSPLNLWRRWRLWPLTIGLDEVDLPDLALQFEVNGSRILFAVGPGECRLHLGPLSVDLDFLDLRLSDLPGSRANATKPSHFRFYFSPTAVSAKKTYAILTFTLNQRPFSRRFKWLGPGCSGEADFSCQQS